MKKFGLGFKLWVKEGFQKGITLGVRISGIFHDLKSRFAKIGSKNFAKYLHLSWDSSLGS